MFDTRSMMLAAAFVAAAAVPALAQSPPGLDTPAARVLRDYNQQTTDVVRLNDARLTADHRALGRDLHALLMPPMPSMPHPVPNTKP